MASEESNGGESRGFDVGDVVEGRFSARPERREQAIVRGRIEGQWYGDVIEYEPGYGYGTWGLDAEVETVLRKATDADERQAQSVKERVSADTDRVFPRG